MCQQVQAPRTRSLVQVLHRHQQARIRSQAQALYRSRQVQVSCTQSLGLVHRMPQQVLEPRIRSLEQEHRGHRGQCRPTPSNNRETGCISLHADLDPCCFSIAVVARSDQSHSHRGLFVPLPRSHPALAPPNSGAACSHGKATPLGFTKEVTRHSNTRAKTHYALPVRSWDERRLAANISSSITRRRNETWCTKPGGNGVT